MRVRTLAVPNGERGWALIVDNTGDVPADTADHIGASATALDGCVGALLFTGPVDLASTLDTPIPAPTRKGATP